MEAYLNQRNPGSFGGVDRFFRSVQENVKDKQAAQEVLQSLDPYTVNKESRKKFLRNRVIVTNLQQQYQMDLADLRK